MENLSDPEVESGKQSAADLDLKPIPAGGADGFRMFFFRDELPRFQSFRVRVEETAGDDERAEQRRSQLAVP